MTITVEMPDGMVDILSRLCQLTEDVARGPVGFDEPTDCVCTRGGTWREGEDGVWRNRHWQHSGRTVDFIERAVRVALDHPEVLLIAEPDVSAVGDPVPAHVGRNGKYPCRQSSPEGLDCTEPEGHDGPHVACGLTEVLAVWTDESAVTR